MLIPLHTVLFYTSVFFLVALWFNPVTLRRASHGFGYCTDNNCIMTWHRHVFTKSISALLVFVALHEQQVASVVYAWDLLSYNLIDAHFCFTSLICWLSAHMCTDFFFLLRLRLFACFSVFGENSKGFLKKESYYWLQTMPDVRC